METNYNILSLALFRIRRIILINMLRIFLEYLFRFHKDKIKFFNGILIFGDEIFKNKTINAMQFLKINSSYDYKFVMHNINMITFGHRIDNKFIADLKLFWVGEKTAYDSSQLWYIGKIMYSACYFNICNRLNIKINPERLGIEERLQSICIKKQIGCLKRLGYDAKKVNQMLRQFKMDTIIKTIERYATQNYQ